MANYATSVKEYIDNIMTDILPVSDLAMMDVNSSGLVILNDDNSVEWSIELPDSVGAGLYSHEKSSTLRGGVISKRVPGVYHSHYVKPCGGAIIRSFDNLVAQSVLELYPLPTQTYGVIVNNSIIAGAVIDYNHMRTKDGHYKLKAVRLDMILHSLGLDKDLKSFSDVQKFIYSPEARNLLGLKTIIQIVLESYFIPNPIGEVDANSRNIIVIFDPLTGESLGATRVDAESNTHFNAINNERSGQRVLPKGIFEANELFKEGFLKAIEEKDSSIDWDLFIALTNLAYKLTTRTKVDESIFNGYRRNYSKVPLWQIREISAAYNHFGPQSYAELAEATIERRGRYFDEVYNAYGGYINRDILPFVEEIEVSKPPKLEQEPLDREGKPLTKEEEIELGLQ